MTVATTISREQYATDGVTTAFAIHFPFFDDSDVNAIFVDAGGVATTLALSTDFSVTGGDGAGGTLTTMAAPASGGALTIFRSIPFTQEDDYVENDPLPADTLEGGFDRAAMRDQQLQDAIDRALVAPVTSPPGFSGVLPNPVANKLIGWNASGDAMENKDSGALGVLVKATIADARAGTDDTEYLTADGVASLWQEGAGLVSAASIAKPTPDSNLGGFYTQTGSTATNSYWAGVKSGEAMQIRYTGAPLLGTSGNLLPPGGVAFQVIAGDIIHWRWDGTASKWRAVGGIRANGTAIGAAVAAITSGTIDGVTIGGSAPGTVDATAFRTKVSTSIPDDGVFTFTPPHASGLVIVTGTFLGSAFMGGAIVNATSGGGNVIKAFGGASFAVIAALGVATGTSGTDGSMNVGADTAGNVYINNRVGSAGPVTITFLG